MGVCLDVEQHASEGKFRKKRPISQMIVDIFYNLAIKTMPHFCMHRVLYSACHRSPDATRRTANLYLPHSIFFLFTFKSMALLIPVYLKTRTFA